MPRRSVNVYDEGLLFKPIHRVIYGADNADFVSILKEKLSSESGKNYDLYRRRSGRDFVFYRTDRRF